MNWLKSRLQARRARQNLPFVQRSTPHLVNMVHMANTSLQSAELQTFSNQLERLEYVGAGVTIYYRDPDTIAFGQSAQIRDYAVLEVGGDFRVGDRSVIGAYNWVQASGSVAIGSGVIIGPHTSIISTSHQHEQTEQQVAASDLIYGTVTIDDNVWIGSNVSILMNVSIGANVTIGSGSVVTRDIPANSVAFGNPCRVQRSK